MRFSTEFAEKVFDLGGLRRRDRVQASACAPRVAWCRTMIQRLRKGWLLQGDPVGPAEMFVNGRATTRGRRETKVPFGSPAPQRESGGKSAKGRWGIHPQVPAGTYLLGERCDGFGWCRPPGGPCARRVVIT